MPHSVAPPYVSTPASLTAPRPRGLESGPMLGGMLEDGAPPPPYYIAGPTTPSPLAAGPQKDAGLVNINISLTQNNFVGVPDLDAGSAERKGRTLFPSFPTASYTQGT